MAACNRDAAGGKRSVPEPLPGFVRPVPTRNTTGLLVLIVGN